MFSFHFALLAVMALLFCMAAAAPVLRDGTAVDVTPHHRRVPLHSGTASTDSYFEAPVTADSTSLYVRGRIGHRDSANMLQTANKRFTHANNLWAYVKSLNQQLRNDPAILAEADRNIVDNLLAIGKVTEAETVHRWGAKKDKLTTKAGRETAETCKADAIKSIDRAIVVITELSNPPARHPH